MSGLVIITLAGMATLVLITLIETVGKAYASKKEAPEND